MSDTQTAWCMLSDHAEKANGPFELGEVTPAIAARLGVSEKEATRLITLLLGEVARMPDGREFFALEGRAVVPLDGQRPQDPHAHGATLPVSPRSPRKRS